MDRIEEKIRELERKQQQLEQQRKDLIAKNKAEEKKLRTHCLIEIGGIAVAILKEAGFEIEAKTFDQKAFASFLRNQELKGGYYSRAMGLTRGDDNDATKQAGE